MSNSQKIDHLNRLVAILSSSLPLYLSSARPWSVSSRDNAAMEVLDDIVQDQHDIMNRAAKLIIERRGAVIQGVFPMEFTDLHDLSVPYLLEQVRDYLRIDLHALEAVAASIAGDRDGEPLAREAVGATKAHLDSLEELVASRTTAT